MQKALIALALSLALKVQALPYTAADVKINDADLQEVGVAPQAEDQDQGPSLPQPDKSHTMALADAGWHAHQPAAPAAAPAPSAQESAHHAHKAAQVAKQAATVANRVAKHSIKITGHAKKALKHALGALHDARVDSQGLSHQQKHSLKKAEARLREATKKADHGDLKEIKEEKDVKKEEMEAELEKTKGGASEKEELQKQVQDLRETLKGKAGENKDLFKALDDLEAKINESDGSSLDESKAELERLREQIEKLEDVENSKTLKDMGMQPLKSGDNAKTLEGAKPEGQKMAEADVTPVEGNGIDVDMAMPYGELEPFGREDTAQELTERSIKESDAMVDQLKERRWLRRSVQSSER